MNPFIFPRRARARWIFPGLAWLVVASGAFAVDAVPPPADADLQEVVELEEGVRGFTAPKAQRQRRPEYPLELQRLGLTGRVQVGFIIDKEGAVRNPYVVSSNNPWFERAALDAILDWKFKPGETDGRPVNVRALQRLDFALPGRDPDEGLWLPARNRPPENTPPEAKWHKPPVPVSSAFPVYPFAALREKKAGKSRVSFVIDTQGRVVRVESLESTAPEFDAAVRAMLDTWSFTPPTKKDGSPCLAIVGMEHEFKPTGFGDAPVSDSAKRIIRLLEKSPERIVGMTDLDKMPAPLSQRPPVYPLALLATKQAGTATIEFFIDERGDAQLPEIVSSSLPEFGFAAAQAIATWRFEPGKRKGRPVVTRVRIPVDFQP